MVAVEINKRNVLEVLLIFSIARLIEEKAVIFIRVTKMYR
jgi:hypothetical protein